MVLRELRETGRISGQGSLLPFPSNPTSLSQPLLPTPLPATFCCHSSRPAIGSQRTVPSSAIMPLFKNLRSRSRSSFRSTSRSTDKSNGIQSNGDVTSGKSSSTIDSASYSSVTPPSSIKPTASAQNLPLNGSNGTSNGTNPPIAVPQQRPHPMTTPSQRNSYFVCASLHIPYLISLLFHRVVTQRRSTVPPGLRPHHPPMLLESFLLRKMPG